MTTVQLRRVSVVLNGGTPTADEANWGGSIPWATPVDLAKVNGQSIERTDRTLTHAGLVSGSTLAPQQSVLVSSRAPIGYTAIARVPMAFNQGCKAVVPADGQCARFLQYCMVALTETMKASGSGSTFSELSSEALASMEIPDITPGEQRRIADFLDDRVTRIDHIITARRSQVDLVTAAYRSTVAATLSTLPTRPIRYLAEEILVGIVIQPSKLYTTESNGIPALRGLNVREGRIVRDDLISITPEGHRQNPRSHLRIDDVVVVRTGDAGSASVVPKECEGWNCIDLVIVRPAPGVSAKFLELALNAARHQASVAAVAAGAMQQHFGVNAVAALEIPYPTSDAADIAANLTRKRQEMVRRRSQLRSSVGLLQEYKQSLITAAVTGELDVTTAGSGIPG